MENDTPGNAVEPNGSTASTGSGSLRQVAVEALLKAKDSYSAE